MKHPNGYGSVVKLSGNRRKPFAVRKTVGWNDKKHPIYRFVGYCETREEGLMLLALYNKEPWDLDKNNITFKELYELWFEKRLPKLGRANQNSLKAAYGHCAELYNTKYKTIRAAHMQDVIDNCKKSYATQAAIKNLFGHLDRFAYEIDVVNKRYSDLLKSDPIPETSKKPFTDEEVEAVWNIQGQPWVDSVLVFLYSGFRISELLSLKSEDIDLKAETMKGGTKTKAGKNRIVPIHSKIMPIIKKHLAEGNEYLFSFEGKRCLTNNYYNIWERIMKQLKQQHTPHECRHTFRTRLDAAGANKVCIDMIMGHKSNEVGERIYTHKTIVELKEAIELLVK